MHTVTVTTHTERETAHKRQVHYQTFHSTKTVQEQPWDNYDFKHSTNSNRQCKCWPSRPTYVCSHQCRRIFV